MAFRKVADAVVAIPYGDAGQRKFRTIGALLETDNNNPAKGLPYILMLDKHFNPAGIQTPNGQDSISISFYHPKQQEAGQPVPAFSTKVSSGFADFDDDIPF